MLDLPEDFTQKINCVLSSEISFSFQVIDSFHDPIMQYVLGGFFT